MAYSPVSQKTYNQKCIRFAIKYTPSEKKESDRLKEYLEKNGLSANGYIKELIKKDLDRKGIEYQTDQIESE